MSIEKTQVVKENLPTQIKKIKKHDAFMKLTYICGATLLGGIGLSFMPDFLMNLNSWPLGHEINFVKNFAEAWFVSTFAVKSFLHLKTEFKIAKKLNQFVNFNDSYLLDKMDNWAKQSENIESIIKHTLVGLYLDKHNIISTNHTKNTKQGYRHIYGDQFYFLDTLLNLVQQSEQFQSIFQKVYQEHFKDEDLQNFSLFNSDLILMKFMVKGFGGKIDFSSQSFYLIEQYNTLGYSELDKEKFKFLFKEENYLQLPKEVRHYLMRVAEKDDAFLESYKDTLLGYEKQLEQLKPHEVSIRQDIEAQKLEQQVKQLNETAIKKTQGLSLDTPQLETVIKDITESSSIVLNTIMLNKLRQILEKSKTITQQIENLSIEDTVEFKNYIEVALPKYLQVFSKSSLTQTQNQEFSKTLDLLDDYLDKCLDSIQTTHNDDFNVADTYFKNKLQQYRKEKNNNHTATDSQNTIVNDKKLSM